ncbi:MAG: ABC transporter permease [Actinomycetes bacterium]
MTTAVARTGGSGGPGDDSGRSSPAPDNDPREASSHFAQRSGESLGAFAERMGLQQSAERPPLGQYLAELWGRRHFIVSFASARNLAVYSTARLGQVWQVLTPLLNAAVYYLVFGILLKTKSGVPNYIAYLVCGIFVFTYTQRSVQSGARAIIDNLGFIRAMHFPRATLPLALVIIELQQLAVSMVVLAIIVLLTGEPLTFAWLLVFPALLLQTMFNVGASFVMARIGANIPDVSQLLPFILRTWLYLSGVFYSIQDKAKDAPHLIKFLLAANPGSVYIELIRDALLREHNAGPHTWLYAIVWAVVGLLVGFTVFYRGEETYGRG